MQVQEETQVNKSLLNTDEAMSILKYFLITTPWSSMTYQDSLHSIWGPRKAHAFGGVVGASLY
jgi:hypothetical protein